MKALMKGNAAKYFQKKEKPVEDIEVTMNTIEARVLAGHLGIAEFELPSFTHFFEHIFKLKLPPGYQKHLNAEKTRVFYVHEPSAFETEEHPSLDLIKVAFYEVITTAKAAHNFEAKSARLLPFVEEKLMKECMGLSSKRRDAEKNNAQRDEEGKVVISKLGRVQPDMRSLISARSYMLKALVEKIYTRRELWGRGKRANTYAAIIAAARSSKNQLLDEDEEEVTEESLQKFQEIYEMSASYYQTHYGNLLFIPDELKNTRAYFRSTPDSVLRNISLLGIDKESLELFWLARLMECLPMPQGWSIRLGSSFEQYEYESSGAVFDLHPSYVYIVQLMSNFKALFEDMDLVQQNYYTNMREMVFYDFFERAYDVDVLGLIEQDKEFPNTRRKAAKKSMQLGTNDWMALEAVRLLRLPEREFPLIEDFQEFWGSLDYREEIFLPAISPYGEVAWSSAINQKTVQHCPHSATLSILREQKLYDFPEIRDSNLKLTAEDCEPDYDGTISEQTTHNRKVYRLLYEVFPHQRQKFLQHFIRNDPKPLSYPYQISDNCQEQDFFQQIFVSPFNLEQNLKLEPGEETPLWLQKVHAKRKGEQQCALLDWKQKTIEEAKEEFAGYALEMTRKHEPEREDEVLKIIADIVSVPELKNFIKYINDIDGREERKRLAKIGLVQEKEDSLGSSLSQIDMEEKMEEDEAESASFDFGEEDEEEEEEEDEKSSTKSIALPEEPPKEEQPPQEDEQPVRVPEKYHSIVYQKDESVEKLSDAELTAKLKDMARQKKLKHKYSQSCIRRIAEELQIPEKSTEIKRNLLISNLHSEVAPYRPNPLIQNKNARNLQTAVGLPDVSENFPPFRSEASEYENSRVQEEIEKWREAQLEKEESVASEAYEPKKFIDETRETIQLQPILKIKPDIEDDPRLRHMSDIRIAQQFMRSFNVDKHAQLVTATAFNPEKTGSTKEYQTPTRYASIRNKEEALLRSSSLISISNKSVSPSKFESRFNRVCLGSTASSLLSTEPLLKKGDLVVLEARKSLLSKGRGLPNPISRKY